jgi:cysteine desulfurase
VAEREATVRRLRRARERLASALTAMEGVELTGHPRDRLPGLVSIIVRDVEGASIVVKLDLEGVAASVGSACTTGSAEPSHVLTAMGYPEEEARGSLRFSLGRSTTDADVDEALAVVPRVVAAARAAAVAIAAERRAFAPAGTGAAPGTTGTGSAIAR